LIRLNTVAKACVNRCIATVFLERGEENESRKIKFHGFGEKEL